MEFYIITWLVWLFCALFYLNKRRVKLYPVIALTLVLAFFVGFRDDIGIDWYNYVFFYENGFALDRDGGLYEPLFSALRFLFYLSGFSYQIFFFVLASFSLLCLTFAAKRMGISNMYLMMFVYISMFFCIMQFNIVRSGIMGSCICVALSYIHESKKKALIWAFIASGFHYVGLLFIPFIFILDRKLTKKTIVVTIISSYAIMLLGFGGMLLNIFPFLMKYERIALFTGSDALSNGLSIGMIMNLLIFVTCYYTFNKSYNADDNYRIVLNTLLLGICICSALNMFGQIATRAGQVANMSLVFLWPFIFMKISKRYRLPVMFVLTAYMAFYFYNPLLDNKKERDAKLVPYKMEIVNIRK